MYAKLFASLYNGTLRGRPDEILVFTNLLAHTSKDGVVDKHPRAIAEETGISLERVNAAIATLEAPDAESRSPEADGARIVRMDEHRVWGWRVVNHAKYRAIRSEEDRAEQNRLAQARWRERNADSKQSKPSVSGVSPCIDRVSKHEAIEHIAAAPADARNERKGKEASMIQASEDIYAAFPRKVGKPSALKAILAQLKTHDAMFLLERTKAYALVRVGEDQQFTPHPSTWFNQQRFNDDPSTWKTTTYAKPQLIPEKRISRSIGTTNEGTAHLYRGLGKVTKAPDVQRAEPGTSG